MRTPLGRLVPKRTRTLGGRNPFRQRGVVHIQYDYKSVFFGVCAAGRVKQGPAPQGDDGRLYPFQGLPFYPTETRLSFRGEYFGDCPPLAARDFLVQVHAHAPPLARKIPRQCGFPARRWSVNIQCLHVLTPSYA